MALNRYTLRQFEAFVAVAEQLGFHAAGKQLGLSASAVSQLVAELESMLGFRLFERTTRRVNLSNAGRAFLPSAEALLRQLKLLENEAQAISSQALGVVKISAPQMLASTLLPDIIRSYLHQNQNMAVRIIDTPAGQLTDRICSGDADLAIGPGHRADNRVRQQALFRNPWALWCSPEHPLAAQPHVQWSQLGDTALATSWYDRVLDTARMPSTATRPPVQIRPVEIVDNTSTAFGLAKTGHVAVLLPSHSYVCGMAMHNGLLHKPIVEPEILDAIRLFRPLDAGASPAAEAFGDFLAHWMRENLPSAELPLPGEAC
jgi:DNA-binding transcriptional LysR family regulator